ncbi:MAG: hypothetical protein HYX72_05580 [Acidobacteria bacterium]|nr:hypothetical protein [Acidobacteriota bacterium]
MLNHAMKQFTITFKDQTTQTINVWEHETPEGWLKQLEPYFRIAGYVYSRDDVVSVSESEFGKLKSRRDVIG